MKYITYSGIFLFLLSSILLVYAQEEPSFDCSLARTPVEKALCGGGNSGMGDLDQAMHDLFKSVSNSPDVNKPALISIQRRWLAERNQCKGAEIDIINCLYDSYRARYIELCKTYDKQHLTGPYVNELVTMDSVFPDGKLAVNISTSSGAPSYDSCSVSFKSPVKDISVKHTFTHDEILSDDKCSVNMKISGTQM